VAFENLNWWHASGISDSVISKQSLLRSRSQCIKPLPWQTVLRPLAIDKDNVGTESVQSSHLFGAICLFGRQATPVRKQDWLRVFLRFVHLQKFDRVLGDLIKRPLHRVVGQDVNGAVQTIVDLTSAVRMVEVAAVLGRLPSVDEFVTGFNW